MNGLFNRLILPQPPEKSGQALQKRGVFPNYLIPSFSNFILLCIIPSSRAKGIYSSRKLLTGLLCAALKLRSPTTANILNKVNNPVNTNKDTGMSMRKAKSSSHLCISHQDIGNAMIIAMPTNLVNDEEISFTIATE